MEKKSTIISLIFVGVVVIGIALTIVFMGITAKDYNYVQIEVNPRVEFICDKKFKVVSVSPLNSDARIVLVDLNLTNKDIEEATTLFLEECAKTGYLDINGANNSTNITVIDGLTQALDVHVTQSVYNFYRHNEIMSAVVENYEDRSMFDAKKKNNLCCPNKYKLISTIIENEPNLYSMETLKKMNEVSLVNLVATKHKNNPYVATEEERNTKLELLEKNKTKYDLHMKSISNNTQKEFSKLFDKFQKSSSQKYFQNFTKEYNCWQEHRSL